MQKTYVIKGEPISDWLMVDASAQNLGRLATQIAKYLLGKHKPAYTPGVDMGDFVVVINAAHISFASRRAIEKVYYRHSGYPGGITGVTLRDQLRNHPDRVIRAAVWGMLPHNKMGRHLLKKLKVYGGGEHPHEAQMPRLIS